MRQIDQRMHLYLAELQGLVRGLLFRECELTVAKCLAKERAIDAGVAALSFSATSIGEVASCTGLCFSCDTIYGSCACGEEYIKANEAHIACCDDEYMLGRSRVRTQDAQVAVELYLRQNGALTTIETNKLCDAISWLNAVMGDGGLRWLT